MERTEILSLFKNTPADGTEITVCGWAKNIRDSKNIGFIALSDGGCFKTLQVVLEAGKLANYDEVIHTGLYSSLRVKGKLVLTPQAKQPFELNAESVELLSRETLYKAAALEQVTHLTDAVQNLKAA